MLLRNITGTFDTRAARATSYGSGFISFAEAGGIVIQSASFYDFRQGTYTLNANQDSNNWGNPMTGHANSSDIHPYNISMLPLISY